MDTSPSYRGDRFPAEIIAHCTWLYFRFSLSFRDVQEMMLERGIEVSHEAIRLWSLRFGAEYARCLRCNRSGCDDTWHLDEISLKIRRMRRFKSIRHAQRLLSVHGTVASHFPVGRHPLTACNYRTLMQRQFVTWKIATGSSTLLA